MLIPHFLGYLESWRMHPDYSLNSMFFETVYASCTWLWLVFFVGMGKTFLNFAHPWLSQLNEAVMPFYIFHQTVIQICGFQIIKWPLGIIAKYLLISSISLTITIMLVYLLLEKLNWLRLFFGVKPVKK